MQGIDLTARQHELERESTSLGVERYQKVRDGREEADLGPGRKLIATSISATADAIAAFIAEADTGKPGRRHAAVRFLRHLDPHGLAYLTATCCVNAIGSGEAGKAVTIATLVARSVTNDINFTLLQKEHKGLHRVVQQQIKKATSARHSTAVMNHTVNTAVNEAGAHIERFEMNENDSVLVGMKLIELFIAATGLVHLVTVTKARSRTVFLRADEALLDWLTKAHDSAAMFLPVLMPMVAPPRDWTSPKDGGYLTDIGGRADLVRTRNVAYKRELELVDMPAVYASLNAIQSTGWKINTPVLEVMKELWDAGGDVAGLPSRELMELPARPEMLDTNPDYYKENHPEEFKAWKRSRAGIYEANARGVSKRISAAQKIALADKFAEFETIYFPHNLDFRGRIYPLPPTLNPQGDDQAKGLLTFSSGVPLGEDGAFWLAVHVANTFGVDKVAFEDRVAWVKEHEELILDSALCALDGRRFWQTSKTPWCALAACFEWLGYVLNGNDHVSHIPCALDGSCNGLQNFSAMLRDPIGGAATNLVPHDKPADIYTEVKVLAQSKIAAAAEAGNELALRLDGLLTRDLVKQPVMTLPYGVTRSGMRSQLLGGLRDAGAGDDWALADYLAAILWDCIGEVVVAAREAMDWLKAASKVASSSDLPVSWTTPAGFPVLQEYREEVGQIVWVHVGGVQRQLVVNKTTNIAGTRLNRRRQTLGISPNYVHSCDASHLMLTTVIACDNGVSSFAMVHDSFGTHAGNTAILAASLRQAFVDQYEGDVLGSFRQELATQLSPELAAELPELPVSGDLDLAAVIDSRYFFA